MLLFIFLATKMKVSVCTLLFLVLCHYGHGKAITQNGKTDVNSVVKTLLDIDTLPKGNEGNDKFK